MEVILGAIAAIMGGLAVEIWRSHARGKVAAEILHVELIEQEDVLDGWFRQMRHRLSVPEDDPGIASADQLCERMNTDTWRIEGLSASRSERTPAITFPPLRRTGWEGHRADFLGVASEHERVTIGLWYASVASTVPEKLVRERLREALQATARAMTSTVRSRAWRRVKKAVHSGWNLGEKEGAAPARRREERSA